MKRTHVLAVALLAATAFSAGAALAADPSLHEVYQAVEAGRLKQAETMMDQVLRDHPNSAKAHFVEAELFTKEGRTDAARAELATAERLAPGLPFAKPDAISRLRRQLETPRATRVVPAAAFAPAPSPAREFPWGLLLVGLGLAAAIVFFIRSMSRSRVMPAGGAGYLSGAGNYGPGYPQPIGAGGIGPGGPAGGGIGSGILGGLATGAAVGAGMVAGEALMHRVFDRGANNAVDAGHADSIADYPISAEPAYDLGGSDFGVSDGGSWDDAAAGFDSSDDWN